MGIYPFLSFSYSFDLEVSKTFGLKWVSFQKLIMGNAGECGIFLEIFHMVGFR